MQHEERTRQHGAPFLFVISSEGKKNHPQPKRNPQTTGAKQQQDKQQKQQQERSKPSKPIKPIEPTKPIK